MARTKKLDVATTEQDTARVTVPRKNQFQPPSWRSGSRKGKKGVLIYVLPEMSQQLRQLALDEDSTVQALGHEAFARLIVQRRRRAAAHRTPLKERN